MLKMFSGTKSTVFKCIVSLYLDVFISPDYKKQAIAVVVPCKAGLLIHL